METNKNIKGIERTIIERIKKEKFDYKSVQRKGSFYNHDIKVNELKASYGMIGYIIYTEKASISVDLELNKIDVEFN